MQMRFFCFFFCIFLHFFASVLPLVSFSLWQSIDKFVSYAPF